MDIFAIRNRLNSVLIEKLRAEYGDTAVTKEPIISELTGHNFGDREVPADRLQAVKQANRIAGAARAMVNEQATEARRHGRSWAEIADALSITADTDDDPAVQAYRRVVGPDWRDTVSWRCACCEQRVIDHGPYDAHPSNAEFGHAEDCERHHREIEALARGRDREELGRDDDTDWGY
ncbi:hypothetical protein [Nocardia sp. NPDC050435]|uniref:hypothetical protein n=1 Tax=Nocardia sp. NPDC050435 TaxID=3155040 RepID=UPI00340BB926